MNKILLTLSIFFFIGFVFAMNPGCNPLVREEPYPSNCNLTGGQFNTCGQFCFCSEGFSPDYLGNCVEVRAVNYIIKNINETSQNMDFFKNSCILSEGKFAVGGKNSISPLYGEEPAYYRCICPANTNINEEDFNCVTQKTFLFSRFWNWLKSIF